MALSVQVPRTPGVRPARNVADSPERWMRAYFRALDAGIDALEIGGGSGYAVESASDSNTVYLVDEAGTTCTCPAGLAGDAVCLHRSVVRFFNGNLPGWDQPEGPAATRFNA